MENKRQDCRRIDAAKALKLFARAFTPPGGKPGGMAASCSLPALTGSADAFLALVLAGSSRTVLVVAPGLPDAERIACDIELLSPNVEALELPPPSEDDASTAGTRMKTARALASQGSGARIVVTTAAALKFGAPAAPKAVLTLANGTKTRLSSAAETLVKCGYERVQAVSKEGEFSIRGGIVDVWSPGDELPVRAEFFGDELESVRSFNPSTQLSVERIAAADILPAVQDAGGESRSVFDMLPDGSAVLALDHNSYEALHPGERLVAVYTGDPPPPGVPAGKLATSPLPGFAELGANEAHHPELFDQARMRLEHHIDTAKRRGEAVFRFDGLSGGFETEGMVVVTKSDRVFAKRKLPRRVREVAGARISDFEDLEPGEYVVHVDYGIGRFIGSSEISTESGRSEVFTVEYADGAKLHVPAAHAHLLSRYVGVKGESPKLHRIDGKRWAKDKKDAERAVADLAAGLLETQAKREITPGFQYDVECDGIDAFEAAFPYEETSDQLSAIAAVKADLKSARPMDRLICGDAGYGKTEVAMRAAFIAAMNGRQTAVLAPTTVLAEQHFETFTSRFDGTPVRIESVSRFQSRQTHGGTFGRLANGVCDIVIGTHAILTPKIRFHDLGLVIIDEEQRFGVRHKEFLKRLRETADVLTMSATPIPRTLYLSMTGARDLSLVRTPPKERVAVETVVARDSDETVRAAIRRETARGGQVFFLHNRVSTLAMAERRLHAIVPEVRTITAHGRMDARELASRMRAFERGECDMLISTTIVESGIDIPNANTIIVDRADTFGMADLYQLRGRVGRSSRQGHALFLLPPSGAIDSDARERLDALKRHGSPGSGFNLAMRDLEIRGAGNLLGAKQSGHIAAVGFTLYCKLLNRTIALLRGEKPKEPAEARLNLDFLDLSPAAENPDCAAAIPYEYIEDDAARIEIMKRIAQVESERDVSRLKAEMEDRFGALPKSAMRLMKMTRLRAMCAAAGIGNLDVRGSRAVFYRSSSREISDVVFLKGGTADAKLAELLKAARSCK